MSIVEIKITNWDKTQSGRRKDQKSYPWFKVRNEIYRDDKLFGLTPGDKWIFLCCMCKANEENSDSFSININLFSSQIEIDKKTILVSLQKLNDIGVLSYSCNMHVTRVLQSCDVDKKREDKRRGESERFLKEENIEPTGSHPTDVGLSLLDLVTIWNEHKGEWLARAKPIASDKRVKLFNQCKKLIPDRLDWIKLISNLANTPWATGRTERKWRANFDFILRADQAIKFLESAPDKVERQITNWDIDATTIQQTK